MSSMAECKERCEGTHGCTGIELSGSRCEIWTRNIEASRGVSGGAGDCELHALRPSSQELESRALLEQVALVCALAELHPHGTLWVWTAKWTALVEGPTPMTIATAITRPLGFLELLLSVFHPFLSGETLRA